MNKEIDINSFYSPYPAVMSFRSPVDRTTIENILYKAFHTYDNGDYQKASGYFNSVLEIDKTNTMSQFYLSICNIEENNFIQAEEFLNELVINKDHIFWEQSNWYLAIVYLKQDKTTKAKKILEKIVDDEMMHQREAEIILKNLD